jgi:integrase
MARSVRARRRTNAKGEVFYQIHGPHPKTGKDGYYKGETFKGPNACKRAKKRVNEIVAALQTLTTDTGKMESRRVSDLAAAFLLDIEERYRWTMSTKQWHVKGKSMAGETRRKYIEDVQRFIIPILGDINLTALELEDVQLLVNKVWQDVSGPAARHAGETMKRILYWGDEQEWMMTPRMLRLLKRLLLPEKCRREYAPNLEHVKACLAVVFGPRNELTRRSYLHRRIMWPIFIVNGIRRGEMSPIEMTDIDWQAATIKINKAHSRIDGVKEPKTKAGVRTIWVPPQALEAIAYKERIFPRERLLFEAGSQGDNVYNGMYTSYMWNVCREAGLSKEDTNGVLHFHGLRHLFASIADDAGVSRANLKLALGHSRIDGHDPTTSGYIHALERGCNPAFAEALKMLEQLMPENVTSLEDALKLSRTGEYYWRVQRHRQKLLSAPADNTRTNEG